MKRLTSVTPWIIFCAIFAAGSIFTYFTQIDPLSRADRIVLVGDEVFLGTAEGETVSIGGSIRNIYLSGVLWTGFSVGLALYLEHQRTRRKENLGKKQKQRRKKKS